MTIGQVIKKLRKEKFLSQEELAEQLNVSPQAVSKWETDTSLPDISQVVPIAHFFGVSTDILFGTGGAADEEEIAAAHERYLRRRSKDFDLIHNELGELIKKYPSNHTLLFDYISVWQNMLADKLKIYRDRYEVLAECERCASILLSYSRDFTVLCETYVTMAYIYIMMEKFDKAEEYIKILSVSSSKTQGALMADLYMYMRDKEKRERQIKENIRDNLDTLLFSIIHLGNNMLREEPDYKAAIEVYKKVEEIARAVFGNDYEGPVAFQVCQSRIFIFNRYIELQDIENALKYLKLFCDYAIDASKRDSYNEKTLLFNEYEHLDYIGMDTNEKAPLFKRYLRWADGVFNKREDVAALLDNDLRYKQIKEDFYAAR
jgi:transcriptional regulator with XRE-family HTH domain